MHRLRFIHLFVVIILIAVAAWPHAAHAEGAFSTLWEIISSGGASLPAQLLKLLVGAVEGVNSFIFQGLRWEASMLSGVLYMDLNYGGAAVNAVWVVLRDICNIAFLGVMILIAFGTIFNVVWSNPFYYRSALVNLIVAALLINFSLPIGQTIVWAGNEAAQVVLKLYGSQDIGVRIALDLGLEKLTANGLVAASSVKIPPSTKVALNNLTVQQKQNIMNWYQVAQGNTGGSTTPIGVFAATQTLTELETCLKSADPNYKIGDVVVVGIREGSIADEWRTSSYASACVDRAMASYASTLSSLPAGSPVSQTDLAGTWNQTKAYYEEIMGSGFYVPPAENNSVQAQAILLFSAVLRGFMLLVLCLSLLCVIVFMILRIPFIWILLATSAPAFFGHAWPLAPGILKKWFANIFGWSIFAPLYLFVIYIALYMLSKQGTLLTAMATPTGALAGGAADLPFSAAIGQLLFFFTACGIFMGGAKWAMDTAFGFSSQAGSLFGKISGTLGASEKEMFGIGTVSSKLGITPAAQALGTRFQQTGGDIYRSAQGRIPMLRSQEETLALRKAQLGVRGAAEEYEKLSRKRIEAGKTDLEAPYKSRLQSLETRLAQEKNSVRRAKLQGEVKKLKDGNVDRLKNVMKGGNRDQALAATEILMADGKLNADELHTAGEMYARISPTAQAAFVQRRAEALQKSAGKMKFEDKKGQRFSDYYGLIGDPKQAEEFYKSAKKGKQAMAVLEAGGNLKLEKKANGQAYTFEELVTKEAPKFSNDQWLEAEQFIADRAKRAGRAADADSVIKELEAMDATGQVRDRYLRKQLDPASQAFFTANAKQPEQALRVKAAARRALADRIRLRRAKREADVFAEQSPAGGAPEKPPASEETKKP